ncbi:MAG: NADH-quinone oxidoreductase subunit NuoH [Bacteroidia bacterium]|nr:NADH-quinone oxidoreductase subunit NuoH [Bacteroidia bacterium]
MFQLLSIPANWLIQAGLSLGLVAVYTLLAVYAERKVSAFIQDRLGPMETGPFGIFQTFADVLKLVVKELIVPSAANRVMFVLAPAIIFISVFAAFGALPLSAEPAETAMNVGLLYILAVLSIDIMGLLMAGWGSNNKYALLGSARSVAQIISYEVPTSLALLSAIMMFGTLNMQEIAIDQGIYSSEKLQLLGIWDTAAIGGLTSWAIVRYPHLLIAFLVYLIAGLAECNRAPFDLPEAESELVSGYHVEYGGFRFALMMLSEYGKMLIVGIIASIIFLGAWNTPLPNIGAAELATWTSGAPGTIAGTLWGSFWLLFKSLFIVFIFIWVRWAYPRIRVDQLMTLCWKYLTPAGFALFLISGVWKLIEVYLMLNV